MRRASPSAMAVFPTPGSPNEDGVVLGTAGEDLHHPADLFVPPDHRVQFLPPGQGGKIFAVLFQHLVAVFRILIGDPLVSPYSLESPENAIPGDPRLLEQGSGKVTPPCHGQEEVLPTDVFVFELIRHLLGLFKKRNRRRGKSRLGSRSIDPRQFLHLSSSIRRERLFPIRPKTI